QQRVAREILWPLRHAVRDAWAAHRKEFVLHQEFGDDTRPAAGAIAHGDVDIVAPEIDERHVCTHVEIDVGVLARELAHARQQPAGGERRHHAHGEAARVGALARFAHRRGDLRQRAAYAHRETLALVGETNAAPRTRNELNA